MTETIPQPNDAKPVPPTKQIRRLIGIPATIIFGLLSVVLLVFGFLCFTNERNPQVAAGFACFVLCGVLWIVIIMIVKRLPKRSHSFWQGFNKGINAYEAASQSASPTPVEAKKRGSSIWKWGLAIVLLSVGGYFAYTSGLFTKALTSAGQTHEKIVEKMLEEKCEVKNASWKQEHTGFFDWTVTVDALVTNKTSETIKATLVAEVFSVDHKILLSKAEQLVIGPRESRPIKLLITEAEEKDKNYYKGCNLRIAKVE